MNDIESPGESASPSPQLLPTPISNSFSSTRSVSGLSSYSSLSASSHTSSGVRSASGSKRRGYVRTQGASFAPSAQSRESVMSLGSIAHLQYYFARTGLLDGKGGRLAKKKDNGEYDIPKPILGQNHDLVDTPIEEEGQMLWEAMLEDGEEVMLPPTVSTYCHRSHYVPPPPDQQTMKRDLVEALENALQALESCEKIANDPSETPTQGFYELQGLQIIDTTTMAIRAARVYYTLHPNPKRLNEIRPDQQLRKELYSILDVLKKCVARNFEGGFREDERLAVLVWVSEVGMMIDQEAKLEEAEKSERKDWLWMDGTKWRDNDRGRDLNFLRFLQQQEQPEQGSSSDVLTPEFFKSLTNGKQLIRMHNTAVKISKRPFGQIDTYHDDTAKPYRRADNLRYWLKAAELRWEIKLKLDVLAIANANPATAADPSQQSIWTAFEETVRQWATKVRAELTVDWNGEEERKLHARAKSLAMASPLGSPRNSPSKLPKKKDTSSLSEEV